MNEKIFIEKIKEYDFWYQKYKNIYISELMAIKEVLYPLTVRNSLEVGCGTGRFTSFFKIDVGIDLNLKFYEEFRGRFKYYVVADGKRLPFKRDTFFFLFSITTICFMKEVQEFLREAHRVLKNDSYFIIAFLNRDSEYGKDILSRKEENNFLKFANLFSSKEVIEMVEKVGFKFEASFQTIFENLEEKTIPPVLKGHDKGGFVAMRFRKII